MELQRRFTRDRVETYSDLILGLPGETYDSFVRGVDQLMENGQHNRIQFNNLSILPNAEMGDPAYQAKYGMVTVESKIINIHGERVELDDDVPEVQDLVVATAAMPAADWRRTRVFCWMTALLHFDKLFQIPLILAHGISGISYRDMIEAFMAADASAFPLLAEINAFFHGEARSIQQGGPEYVFSKEYLGIYWPADEFIFVKLTAEGKFDAFYAEAGRLLREIVSARSAGLPIEIIDEAVRLNHALVHQPFAKERPGGAAWLRPAGLLAQGAQRRAGGAAPRRRWSCRSTAPASPTTTSRSGAARSSGGATRRAPISIRRARRRSRPSSPATTEP